MRIIPNLPNIKVRLTLWYLLILAVLLLFFSVLAYSLVSQELSRRSEAQYSVQFTQMDGALFNNSDESSMGITDVNYRDHAEQVLFYQFNSDQLIGHLTESGGSRNFIPVNTPDGPLYVDISNLIIPVTDDSNRVLLNIYPSLNQPNVLNILTITSSKTDYSTTLTMFRQTLFISIALTLFLAGFLGYFLVKKMLRPVQLITQTTKEIEERNLNKRLTVESKDEIGQLASTLNNMFERLEAAFKRERQFTADASHELRTPLAIAQVEATTALGKKRSPEEYQRTLEAILQEIDNMTSIISRLLFLARSDTNKDLELEDLELNELITELAWDIRVLCDEKGIDLTLTGLDSLVVNGDGSRLRELFLNLLDNAIRYTPRGGKITISFGQQGEYAYIEVKDTGIGIPEEDMPHLFKRFYRADKARSRSEGGAGLGLAISQRIAELHGGRIEVRSKVREGSTFTVLLPLISRS